MDQPGRNQDTSKPDEHSDPTIIETADSNALKNIRYQQYASSIKRSCGRFFGWLFKANSNHVIAAATVATAVAAIFYTIYAGKQLDIIQGQLDQMKGGSAQTDRLIKETHELSAAAKSQAETSRKLIEGLNAASMNIRAGSSPDLNSVTLNILNQGKVIATDFDFNVRFIRKTLPEFLPVGRPTPFRIQKAQVSGGENIGRFVRMEGLSADVELFRDTREAISMEGAISYGNGFGKQINEQVCLLFIDARNKPGGGSVGFIDCDDAKAMLSLILDRAHSTKR